MPIELRVIELDDAGVTAIEPDALYRLTLPIEQKVEAPQEESESGDVTFGCIAVDKKKQPNRKGFVFDWDKPEDVILANFLANPTMLYAHNRDYYPVGRWEQVDVTSKAVILHGRIPGGPDYADINPIRVRVRDGYLKAVSIGFYIRKFEEVKDPKTGDLLYWTVKQFEIVECSLCPIGAHETAIIADITPIRGHDGASSAKSALMSYARPVGAKWLTEDQFDTKRGGLAGRVFRLSLDAEEAGVEIVGDDEGEPAEEQPYPNEHACRLQDPGKFEKFARKNGAREHEGKKYDVIFGIRKDGKSEEQAYRYPTKSWKAAEAQAHCKANKGAFEPAKQAEEADGEKSQPLQDKDLSAVSLLCRGPLEEQEGRVLSKKTRAAVEQAAAACEAAAKSLHALLAEADKDKGQSAKEPPTPPLSAPEGAKAEGLDALKDALEPVLKEAVRQSLNSPEMLRAREQISRGIVEQIRGRNLERRRTHAG